RAYLLKACKQSRPRSVVKPTQRVARLAQDGHTKHGGMISGARNSHFRVDQFPPQYLPTGPGALGPEAARPAGNIGSLRHGLAAAPNSFCQQRGRKIGIARTLSMLV